MNDLNISHGPKRRHWVAIGFVFAFLLSTATIIFTGLLVTAPRGDDAERPTPTSGSEAADPAAGLIIDPVTSQDEASSDSKPQEDLPKDPDR